MKKIFWKAVSFTMVLMMLSILFVPPIVTAESYAGPETSERKLSCIVTNELIQTTFEKNGMKLVYRVINNSSSWSTIGWKTTLNNASVVATTYSEFPSMFETFIPLGKDNSSEVLIPPGSRGIVTIFVLLPPSLVGTSVSVEFTPGKQVKLDPELEKYLMDIREPDPEDLVWI